MKRPEPAENLSLRAVQETLFSAVTLGDDLQRALDLVDTSAMTASASERLSVYADAWFIRFEESLTDDFLVLSEKLGSTRWHETLRAYLKAYPSRSFTMARAGDALPDHLQSSGFPSWQVELSRLELDMCRTLTAADSVAFDVAQVQTLSEAEIERLTLRLQPNVFLHQFSFNVLEVHDGAEPLPAAKHVVIYREEWGDDRHASTEAIDHREFDFLLAAKKGATLGEMADLFGESDWVSWLVKWSRRGAIGP